MRRPNFGWRIAYGVAAGLAALAAGGCCFGALSHALRGMWFGATLGAIGAAYNVAGIVGCVLEIDELGSHS